MKIASIQQHLDDLARFLEGASAATAAKQIRTLLDGLKKFADMEVKAFVDHLQKADAYLSGNPPPTRSTRTSTRAAGPSVNLAEVIAKVKHLYENAKDLSVSEESIRDQLKLLDNLSKADLAEVAKAVELRVVSSWAKAKLQAEITKRIIDRRDNRILANFIDVDPNAP